MKRFALLLAFILVAAACGDDDAGGSTATTGGTATTQAPAVTTTTAAGETTTTPAETTTTGAPTTTVVGVAGPSFAITTVSFGTPMIVIHNVGDESGSLAGHWLCQRPSYQELPDIELAPGEGLAISLGGDAFLPPPGVTALDHQLNLGPVSASGGEMGLYSSNSFGSADAIVSYVEWGNSGHGRSGTAIQAGLWEDGAFVGTTGESLGISLLTFDDTSAAGWASD